MKNILFYIFLFSILFISCEEVVDVNLDNSAPKIVIDASILWEKGTLGNEQKIRITTTGNYYNTVVPAVNGALVTVENSTGTIFNFIEESNTGIYKCNNFTPQINENYTLKVISNGITYTSTDKLIAVPEITNVVQRNDAGFLGEDIELKFMFQDNGAEENYYLEDYRVPFSPFPLYGVFDDEYTNGNQIFSLIFDEDFQAGQNIQFKLHGITERYYNYMNKIIAITTGSSNGPFSTPPATVRGNIINTNNPKEYPLGYFRLSELSKKDYTIQ